MNPRIDLGLLALGLLSSALAATPAVAGPPYATDGAEPTALGD